MQRGMVNAIAFRGFWVKSCKWGARVSMGCQVLSSKVKEYVFLFSALNSEAQ